MEQGTPHIRKEGRRTRNKNEMHTCRKVIRWWWQCQRATKTLPTPHCVRLRPI